MRARSSLLAGILVVVGGVLGPATAAGATSCVGAPDASPPAVLTGTDDLGTGERFLQRYGAAAVVSILEVRTDEEVGSPKVPGQADSAPHKFDIRRHLLKAALLGALLFAIYYANWSFGWVTPDDLDFYH